MVQKWVAESEAYLALSLAALGDRDAARKQFRLASNLLTVNKEERLLNRCRAAVG